MYDDCSLSACLHTIFKNLLVSSACCGRRGSNQRQNLSCSEGENEGGKRRGLVVTDKLSHSMLIRWWHQSINQSYILGLFQYTARRLSKQSKDKHRQFCFMNDPGIFLQVSCSKHLLHCKGGDKYLDGGKDADSDDDGKISDDDGIIHPVKVA